MRTESVEASSLEPAQATIALAEPSLYGTMADTLGELIDAIAASDRMIASVAAWRAQLVDEARRWSEVTTHVTGAGSASGWNAATVAHRELVTELACALRLPERTTENLIATSRALVHELPATLHALRDGHVSYRHAQSIVDHAAFLPSQSIEVFEAAVLPVARRLTVAQLERAARKTRERLHPESLRKRRECAVENRTVTVEPAQDGMAWLSAYLPAEQALGIDDRLRQLAGALKTDSDPRTLSQLRADVLVDLLCDGEIRMSGRALGRGIRARVMVTVPVLTLLGSAEDSATLAGYGPIDAVTARRLAAHAPSFTRLLTHPETGAVLSVGRDRYTVPADLRAWLQVRDETCRFPGCSRRSSLCEIDHTVDWQHDGSTRHDNLAHLCPSHHHVKHQTRWAVKNSRDGKLTWTSPSGRNYTTTPAVHLRATGP